MPTNRVVVIGAGFGGMQTAQSLAKANAEVLLIDRENYHTFVPMLYQVATAQIEPEMIAYPLRNLSRRVSNLRFLQAEIQGIDFTDQLVKTDKVTIAYDYLVLATGSQTRFLGASDAEENAFPLRTLKDAIALRNHIFQCFEAAAQEIDPIHRQQLLSFVIVGGGPTGVEIAGALVELKRGFKRDYPNLNPEEMQIILVQSGENLLTHLPDRLGRYTTRKLRQLGVKVSLETRVNRVAQNGVELENGAMLASETVIWTAGLEAAFPKMSDAVPTARQNKLKVRSSLQLTEYDNVYAIGDLAYYEHQGKPLTGVAPEALQQGVAVARNINGQLQGKSPQPFRYFNKGHLAIIGCYAGVGKIASLQLTGFLPWLMWLNVHLVYLPGFRARLLVVLSWLHGYLLRDRSVRLILSEVGLGKRDHNLSLLSKIR